MSSKNSQMTNRRHVEAHLDHLQGLLHNIFTVYFSHYSDITPHRVAPPEFNCTPISVSIGSQALQSSPQVSVLSKNGRVHAISHSDFVSPLSRPSSNHCSTILTANTNHDVPLCIDTFQVRLRKECIRPFSSQNYSLSSFVTFKV